MRYCFDTSALVEPWVRLYPPDVFPPVWETLERLANDGVIAAPVDVRIEIERQSDALRDWANAKPMMFLDITREVLEAVTEIVNRYPLLVKPNSTKSQADPFVIATARLAGVPVVTYEKRAGKGCAPQIPNVCDDLKIRVVDLVDVLREQGLRL